MESNYVYLLFRAGGHPDSARLDSRIHWPCQPTSCKIWREILSSYRRHERLEGDAQSPALRIIIEWPSHKAAIDFMNDPEYTPHLKARTAGSVSHHALIEGKDDLG